MSADDQRTLVARFYDEIVNSGRLEVAGEIFATDFVDHTPTGTLTGLESLKGFLRSLWAAFPDIRFVVDDLIVVDDKVVARGNLTATHEGEFMGIPATGRRAGWTAIHIWRVENGRLKERWAEANILRLLAQLRGG
jgi:steroid delta-isomerase-like uncharacterized protein